MPIDGYPAHDPENRCGRYILDDDGNPVPEPDLFKWATWLEAAYQNGERVVQQDELEDGHWVSTVFLALDYNHMRLIQGEEGGPPILYETMVFNDYGSLDTDWACERYATRAEALAGHQHAVTELTLWLQEKASEAL